MTEIIIEGYLDNKEDKHYRTEQNKVAAYRRKYIVNETADKWRKQIVNALMAILPAQKGVFRIIAQVGGFENANADFVEQSTEQFK